MIEFASPDGAVVVSVLPEVGGRLHGIRVDGRDILRTPDDPEEHRRDSVNWGSYPMIPWCNRIPGGVLRYDGIDHQQALDFPGHAIHGRVYTVPWTDAGGGRFEYADAGDDDFPWPYLAWQELVVDDGGVGLTVGIDNTGASAMPAGLGIHPWFDARDPLLVRLPADEVYPSEANIPTGDPQAVVGARDLRTPRAPEWGLDEAWTGLTGDAIDLTWPERGLRVRYGFSAEADHIVLAALPAFQAVAIEPQTHGVDGHARLERGERGAIGRLEPGRTLRVAYRLDIERSSPASRSAAQSSARAANPPRSMPSSRSTSPMRARTV